MDCITTEGIPSDVVSLTVIVTQYLRKLKDAYGLAMY